MVGFDPTNATQTLLDFRSRYQVPEGVAIYGPWQGRLANTEDEVGLKELTLTNAGVYGVLASNPQGSDFQFVEVQVQSAPEVVQDLIPQTVSLFGSRGSGAATAAISIGHQPGSRSIFRCCRADIGKRRPTDNVSMGVRRNPVDGPDRQLKIHTARFENAGQYRVRMMQGNQMTLSAPSELWIRPVLRRMSYQIELAEVSFEATRSRAYRVDFSPDRVSWSTLSVVTNFSGTMALQHENPPRKMGFYRAEQLPNSP